MRRLAALSLIMLVPGALQAAASEIAAAGPPGPRAVPLTFEVATPGPTSAGIYDTQGRLVRVLWTMKTLLAGSQKAMWDGRDDQGNPVPPGKYQYRILLNRAVYRNVGAIGNRAEAPGPASATPCKLLALATDSDGAIYAGSGCPAPGFKKWDSTGRSLYQAILPNAGPDAEVYAIAVDTRYVYCAVTDGGTPGQDTHQIWRFRKADGKPAPFSGRTPDGVISIYAGHRSATPRQAEADLPSPRRPLHGLAVYGQSLFAVDGPGSRVVRFDRDTGMKQSAFAVSRPQALGIDSEGNLWVAHAHHRVSSYRQDGTLIREAITDIGEVESLSVGPHGELYVADSADGQVRIYNVAGSSGVLLGRLGRKAAVGDYGPGQFYFLSAAAVDREGNLITINRIGSGSRLARWSPDGRLCWELMGLECAGVGNYSPTTPDVFYTLNLQRYRLIDHNAGKWEYQGCMAPPDRDAPCEPLGAPRMVHLGSIDFCYVLQRDGVHVFRHARHGFQLAAMVGGLNSGAERRLAGLNIPAPEDSELWTWHDTNGNGRVEATEFLRPRRSGRQRGTGGLHIDSTEIDREGSLWFCDHTSGAVWVLKISSLDAWGNPVYDWSRLQQALPRDTSAFGFRPLLVRHDTDGSLYALGSAAGWQATSSGSRGTALVKFDRKNRRLWAVRLPESCAGIDIAPGGSVLAAGTGEACVYHYSPDGLLIGKLTPGEPLGGTCGGFENAACVAVNRDPRDRQLDVFVADTLGMRIGWYRINDREVKAVSGTLFVR